MAEFEKLIPGRPLTLPFEANEGLLPAYLL